jgi:hypothetical protein
MEPCNVMFFLTLLFHKAFMTQMDFKNADIHSYPFLMKMCVYLYNHIWENIHKVTLHGYKFFFEGGGGSQVLLTLGIFALIAIF